MSLLRSVMYYAGVYNNYASALKVTIATDQENAGQEADPAASQF